MNSDLDKTNTLPITSARQFLKGMGIDAKENEVRISSLLSVDDQRRVRKHHLVKVMARHGVDQEFFNKYWRRGKTSEGKRILAMYARKFAKNASLLGLETAYDKSGMPANITPISISLPDEIDFQSVLGYEGEAAYRLHLRRERDGRLVEAKRMQVIEMGGKLECEACKFDFELRFGALGRGFCEVHHRVPLSARERSSKTRLIDLAILCSNCHRMIHRTKPLMSVEEFRETFFQD